VTRAALPAHAAIARRARHDHEDVGAERADLLGDLRLRAGADRHHGDDRGDPDDDAEHGEEAAHLVGAQRPERDAEALDQHHAAAL
jgi:hypothetical protein